MTPPVTAPISLGCCPDDPRCVLCSPRRPPPAPEVVAALLEHTRTERAGPGDRVEVGFFGGPPPDDALLDAIGDTPFRCRVRPDLLSRDRAVALAGRGCVGIELDALSFDDRLLGWAGRGYRSARVEEMCAGLRGLGLEVGAVLAPGLPGSIEDDGVRDAARAVGRVDFVRIHPVLVLRGSRLERAWRQGRYRPMPLEVAIEVCGRMADVLEAGGVAIRRIGLQPGPDEAGVAVAGPVHPSLREQVETLRVRRRLRRLLDGTPPGAHVVIGCAPQDEGRTRGPLNDTLKALRDELRLGEVRVEVDAGLARGAFTVRRTR